MLIFFNFKRNIFGRKVSERTLLKGWMSKVWILDFYSFLNEIFSAEKCPNGIIDKVWMSKVWNFDFYSFLNEIFSAEKCPNRIIDRVWMARFVVFSRF